MSGLHGIKLISYMENVQNYSGELLGTEGRWLQGKQKKRSWGWQAVVAC